MKKHLPTVDACDIIIIVIESYVRDFHYAVTKKEPSKDGQILGGLINFGIAFIGLQLLFESLHDVNDDVPNAVANHACADRLQEVRDFHYDTPPLDESHREGAE